MDVSTRSLAEKRAELAAALAPLRADSDRLALLVVRARQAPPLAAAEKSEAHLVPGCLAKLWLAGTHANGLCQFRCDSESLVVKAIAHTLCELHSGVPPAEVLASTLTDLAPFGVTQHLTPNRRNALSRVMERLHEQARQFLESPAKTHAAL